MPTNTYVALATTTLGSAVASVTFSSISSAYTDLELVVQAAGVSANFYQIQLNGDTSALYSRTRLVGDGSSATSSRNSGSTSVPIGDLSSSVPDASIIKFQNYSNTSVNKTFLYRANLSTTGTTAGVGLYRSNSAITSITIFTNTSTFAAGSTFSLYGIASSGAGAKATGGTVYSDSQYFYHVFNASSTFTPTQSITADVLVVAGGGGGGRTIGGGGGGGGLLGFTSQSLTATSYNVTVGAGGAGSTVITSSGTNGVDSQFGALTLVKGGGGGGSYSTASVIGGSGGGGGWNGGSNAGAAATSGQGFSGGAGWTGGDEAAGGGGGAGAVGGTGISTAAGSGGIGSSSYSSWGSATTTGQLVSGTYYYAGGGGGGSNSNGAGAPTAGAGGSGGGASGRALASAGVPTAALANTGGGGGGSGGSGNTSNGGAGGSGIVIVRYAK